jgi:hypothetical protein
MVVVNGMLCSIQPRKGGTKSPNGREYARFDVNDTSKKDKVALSFAKNLVCLYSH